LTINSGDTISLVIPGSAWAPSQNMVRVEHGGRHQPPADPHGGPGLDYYVMGGPDTWVWATTAGSYGFSPGFPAYTGTDPDEWVFYLDKAGGGQINSGDEISIRIGQTRINEGPYYFRVSGSGDGADIMGDGTAPFTAETAFTVKFIEVRAPLGVRPSEVSCQVCAAVTGTVRGPDGTPIAGATVTAQGAAVTGHPFFATTDASGRFRLNDADGRDCIPPGPLSVIASADRYQTGAVTVTVPGQGSVDTDIQLACTIVEGTVVQSVDGSEQPVPGVEVTLTYADTGEGVVATTDPVTGRFRFVCVRHTRVQVQTDDTSAQDVNMGNPIPDTGVHDVKIVIPGPGMPCPVITGTVTDATTGAPIANAKVTVQGTTPPGVLSAQTDANGHYTITNVCLTGTRSVKASAAGYTSAPHGTGMLPVTGTVTVNFALQPVPVQRMLKVWNTGVDSNAAKLTPGATDPHWQLVAGPGVMASRAPFVVTDQHPLGQYFATADSMWIGQDAAGSGDVGSPYTFRLSFDLTGFDPASVRITGAWGVDNDGDITLNGQPPAGTGTFSLTGAVMDNFNVEHDFTITGGFVAGMNTLDIQVTNTGGPAGLNVTSLTISGTPV
jgi:hypothetical protein